MTNVKGRSLDPSPPARITPFIKLLPYRVAREIVVSDRSGATAHILHYFDSVKQSFTADVVVRLRWRDPRLSPVGAQFPLTDIWHSDETFRAEPPMGTMLRALIVPEIGGDTMFASMSAAFEGLSDRMQHFVSGLQGVHDFKPFRQLFSGDAEGRRSLRDFEDRYPPAVHPVVRLHPASGRKVLFVNPQFTVAIAGMEETESRSLLDQLFRQAMVPEYQIRHHWRPNTLVFWDNRAVQHYAIHDYYPQRRKMERVTMKGDKPVGVPALEGASVKSQKSNRDAGDKAQYGAHKPLDVKEPERA